MAFVAALVLGPARVAAFLERLTGKVRRNLDDIIRTESYRLDDADIAIVSYGVSSRSSLAAVDEVAPDAAFAAQVPRAVKYIGWPMLVVRLH